MKVLAKHNIYWIEEPTAPDDAYGHSLISKEMKIETGRKMEIR